MAGFGVEDRERLRAGLLDFARADSRLSGAAITGSAAAGREDKWSDIDLAFGVAEAGQVGAVMRDFTEFLEARRALHHHDIRAGAWTYRVFFLPGGLQVDLAFVEQAEFRPLGPHFRLEWGAAGAARTLGGPAAGDLISMAWLHAIHARSSLLRGKLWQAEYMISAVRDHCLALACLRLGLETAHGRGIDALPDEVKTALAGSLAGGLEADELWGAFAVVLGSLVTETGFADPGLADRAGEEIRGLASR